MSHETPGAWTLDLPADVKAVFAERLRLRERAPHECWPWTPEHVITYGQVAHRGVTCAAHRAAWIIANGPIPEGLLLRHICDNPPCVNPSHLQLGTQLDNARDMSERIRNGGHRWPLPPVPPPPPRPPVEVYVPTLPPSWPMPPSEEFSRRRKALGLTRQQVADLVGVSSSSVANWETGRSEPPCGPVGRRFALLMRDFKQQLDKAA